jgi:GGDEF domain-containing protein/CheY-like chemotaxis protein
MGDNRLRVLVLDDEMSVRMVLDTLLTDLNYNVTLTETLTEAKATFEANEFDLVVTDKNLPDGSGIELAQKVIDERPEVGVVIMSAFANLESAVEAIRRGVADYLVKPFENLNDVSDRLERVVKTILLQRENEQLMGELRETNERLEELVVRDSLTGLFNHAYFQERLEAEVRRSQRHEHRFGLVFFDVDHFKEVNDGLGHQVGDSVLKQISEILRGNTRASDDSFRLREHDLTVLRERQLHLLERGRQVDAREDRFRHVLHMDELARASARDRQLVFQRAGDVAVQPQVLALVLHAREIAAHDVVVRQDETVGRDERGRAAAVSQSGQLRLLQPLRRDLDAVDLLDVLERRLLEQPHLA